MFGIDDAILGAGLSFGGKLLSGLGGMDSAKKSNKLAAANNQMNQWLQQNVNATNAALGQSLVGKSQELMARSDMLPSFDLGAWMQAGDAAGLNRVTWLNSGSLSLFDHRQEKSAMISQAYNLVGQGTQLQSPGMTPYSGGTQGYSAMSAMGPAIAGVGDALTSQAESAKQLAAKQDWMSQFVSAVAAGRAGGNPMAGLGTPSFSTAGPLVTGGGAAAALSLGRKEVLDAFEMKHKPAEVFDLGWFGKGYQDPSLPAAVNVDAAYGWPAGPLYGFTAKLGSDIYWSATGRSLVSDFPADWSLAKRDFGYSGSSSSVRNADLLQAWSQAQPGIVERNVNNITGSSWWSWPYNTNPNGYQTSDPWSLTRLQ